MNFMLKCWRQCFVTLLCNIGTLTCGIHAGWLAPLHLQFTSDESPLGKNATSLTTEEISWIGSLPAMTFLLATPIYGFLLQKIGRRMSALLAILPSIGSFLLLIFASNVWMIYAARFIAGFTCAGSLLVTPIYVNESTSDDFRAFLCGLTIFFVNIGMLVSAIAGSYLPYRTFNGVCLSFSIFFLLFYVWLPETPVLLITQGRQNEAHNALKKLRRGTRREIEEELSLLQRRFASVETRQKSLKEVMSDKAFTHGLYLAVGVMAIHQLSGYPPLTAYYAKVLHESGSNLSVGLASTIITLTLPCGSLLGACLIDRVGRKVLYTTALLVMATTLSVLILFSSFRNRIPDEYGWVPAATMSIYMGTFSSGIDSVAYVLIAELFQPDVRGISGGVCGTLSSIIGFLNVKFFPIFLDEFSLPPVLGFFVLTCIFGTIFACWCLIETMGRSPNEIVQLLRGSPAVKLSIPAEKITVEAELYY